MQTQRINYLVEKKDAILTEVANLKILTYYVEDKDQMYLTIFRGRKQSPIHNSPYQDLEKLQSDRLKIQKHYIEWQEAKEARKAEQKAKASEGADQVKVGDIFVRSWGYDQTQIDYYLVTEKLSKWYVNLVPIASETVPGSEGINHDKVMPCKDLPTGQPERRKITDGNTVSLGDSKWCWRWSGKARTRTWGR